MQSEPLKNLKLHKKLYKMIFTVVYNQKLDYNIMCV